MMTCLWSSGRWPSTWGSGNVQFLLLIRDSPNHGINWTNGKFQITNYGEGEVCAANAVFDTVRGWHRSVPGDWAGYWAAGPRV